MATNIQGLLLCLFFVYGTPFLHAENIKFTLIRNLIVVEASVGGLPGNYIFDTGTPNIVLNARFFEGRPVDRSYYGINGEAMPLSTASVRVDLGGNRWNNIYAEIVPMKNLENSLGVAIHGLIGTRIFNHYTVELDFRQNLLRIEKTGKEEMATLVSRHPHSTGIPFLKNFQTPAISLQIDDDLELRMLVDSGAEINLIEKGYGDRVAGYLMDSDKRLVGGIGPRVKHVSVRLLYGLNVGGYRLQPMRTALVSLKEFNLHKSGPAIDGIIGTELLRQFEVAIDFRNRLIYLWPFQEMAEAATGK